MQYILQAFLLGLVGGAVPGSVLIATFTEVLRSGFVRGSRVIFWALLAETAIALGILAGIRLFHPNESVFYGLSVIGGLYILYLAWQVAGIRSIISESEAIFTPGRIAIATLLNGSFWIFWITICVPIAFELDKTISAGYFLFIPLFEAGWFVSTLGLAFIFSRFRRLLTGERGVRITFVLMALFLGYTGVELLYSGVKHFL